jgi:hypothetical protein
MGTNPSLNPKKLSPYLKNWVFMKPGKGVPTNNIVILMGEEPQYHFTPEEISLLYY